MHAVLERCEAQLLTAKARAESYLRFEESLLEHGREALHLWESPVYFVVLGRSGPVEEDVNLRRCAADAIPVLRRASGGGTVLQGPGCLNYSLVLSLNQRPELTDIPESYEILLSLLVEAMCVPGLECRGSDLLLDDRKVSGSAQRRTRGWLLHHGTLLYGMDLGLIEKYLREPRKQPAHRRGRTHSEFLSNLPLGREELVHSVRKAIEGSTRAARRRGRCETLEISDTTAHILVR